MNSGLRRVTARHMALLIALGRMQGIGHIDRGAELYQTPLMAHDLTPRKPRRRAQWITERAGRRR